MTRYNIGAYEKVYGLYMIFSVKNNRIHCFKEGNTKEEFLLRGENLDRYMDHLVYCIDHYAKTNKLFNGNDYKIIKRLEKYRLYKKRLDNAISKIVNDSEVAI